MSLVYMNIVLKTIFIIVKGSNFGSREWHFFRTLPAPTPNQILSTRLMHLMYRYIKNDVKRWDCTVTVIQKSLEFFFFSNKPLLQWRRLLRRSKHFFSRLYKLTSDIEEPTAIWTVLKSNYVIHTNVIY